MKPQQFIEQLKRCAGVEEAFKIAARCMRATGPEEISHVPKGPIFTEGDRKGHIPLSPKHLAKVHEYWKQCYYLLKKQREKR